MTTARASPDALDRRPPAPMPSAQGSAAPATPACPPADERDVLRLRDVAPGRTVVFVGFDATIDAGLRERVLAYGLAPRRALSVLQHAPVTVVVCDHAEIALEAEVARAVHVRPA